MLQKYHFPNMCEQSTPIRFQWCHSLATHVKFHTRTWTCTGSIDEKRAFASVFFFFFFSGFLAYPTTTWLNLYTKHRVIYNCFLVRARNSHHQQGEKSTSMPSAIWLLHMTAFCIIQNFNIMFLRADVH